MATSNYSSFCSKLWKWTKSSISTDISNWWTKKTTFSLPLKRVSTYATKVKNLHTYRKFGFLTKFYIVLCHILLHLPTQLIKRSSVTFDDSFTKNLRKTINFNKYFIRGAERPFLSNFHFSSVIPIFIPISVNLKTKIAVFAIRFWYGLV